MSSASLLRPGGYLCLHDYGPKFPGVTWAADRFLQNNPNYRRATLTGSLLVIQKSEISRRAEVGTTELVLGNILTLLHKFRHSVRKRLGRVG
jgi:hypothetical protein